jgi:thioredoxin 1
MGQAVRVTDKTFGLEVLESERPVLVDFWASWCPPCKMVEPVLDELADEYEDRVLVCKLHVDRNPKTRDRYQIFGVPTFAVFRDGELVSRRTGAQSKGQLEALLGEVL